MKRLLLVLAVCSSVGLSAAQEVPLSDISPGQTGYGITAGPGNVLERFDVDILGVQQDVGLAFPLILVRAGGSVIEASGGVAAGMSGSPVYLEQGGEDALVGAVGYVFPSSDHTLALVTPIEAMRESAAELSTHKTSDVLADYGLSLADAVPVSTPLLFSGLSERAGGMLDALFEGADTRLLPVQLGGAGSFDEDAYELQPGSAVSVQLVRGDITIAAVGTLTALEDDGTVLAFGHPLLGEGEVSFALAPAFVSHIVPSDVVPFKLANNGREVLGTISEDRPAAIAGRLDETPRFLPVTLTLSGRGQTLGKSFEITDDERYYAPLLASATLQLFDELRGEVSAGTADLAWEITLRGGETVRVLEQISDPNDIVGGAAQLAATPLAILAENIFAAPEVTDVAINLTFEEEQRYAEIIEVVAQADEVDPGDIVIANVRLQPYRQEPTVTTVRLRVPDDAEGSLDIIFRGGLEAPDTEGDEEDPILSFGELLVALKDQVQSSELIVETFVEDETVRLERVDFPYLIQGEESLVLTVNSVEGDDDEPEEDDDEPEEEPDEDFPEPNDPAPPPEPTRDLIR